MNRLKKLLRAIDARVLPRNADSMDSLRASTRSLRHDLRSSREALADLTTELRKVQLQIEQLFALRRDELDTPARMDRLEHILDTDRMGAHMREAVARTELVEDPVPHAIISDLLPSDVYDAAIHAIPSPIFFEGGGACGQELRVPPRIAPTYSIATWSFLADMVSEVLGPALVARFQGPLDRHVRALCPSLVTSRDAGIALTVESGRIVLRRPGHIAPRGRPRPWHFLTVIAYLATPDDGEDYGSRLHRESPDADSKSRVAKEIPFRANSALIVLDTLGAHEYAPIPPTAPHTAARYTYECRIVPDTETRRLLRARMDDAARRAWEAQG